MVNMGNDDLATSECDIDYVNTVKMFALNFLWSFTTPEGCKSDFYKKRRQADDDIPIILISLPGQRSPLGSKKTPNVNCVFY